jgi:hypothetical protein
MVSKEGVELLGVILDEYDRYADPKVQCSACGSIQPMWSTETKDQGLTRICIPTCWAGANLPERGGGNEG